MLGAIIGDIVGSVYEWNIKNGGYNDKGTPQIGYR